jgi:hypothetical protein
MNDDEIDLELVAYQVKLLGLTDRYAAGARSVIAREAQSYSDALICLMEVAPLDKRGRIDHLIDQYEALRVNSEG